MIAYVFFVLFLLLCLLKVALLFVIFMTGNNFFGGGNDADYYNNYALGYENFAVNIWPVILRHLNEMGLYSRDGISLILKFLGFIAIPFLVAKLTYVKNSPYHKRTFWGAVVVMSAYPTLIYFATDIYRDIFMVFIWVLGLFVFRFLSHKPGFIKGFPSFVIGVVISYVLFEFRPYLGLGFLAALIFSTFYSFRRYSFFLSLFAFLIILFGLFCGGLLDPIINYRAGFFDDDNSSSLGITFSSPARFFPDLAMSIAFQLFGVFIINVPAVIVFMLESLPFTLFFFYVIKNRAYSTKFVDYLIVFFITYSVVWLLGNDNLGTSVRLRIYSYTSIFIAFCIIYQNKKMLLDRARKNLNDSSE
ncbi:MAG: hypothetical protein B0W54_13615 [Cellvibrio sp. 79]|nr:MAG: hypothetical protein B0W54_13615 [Cellvibrio sp. 79]